MQIHILTLLARVFSQLTLILLNLVNMMIKTSVEKSLEYNTRLEKVCEPKF